MTGKNNIINSSGREPPVVRESTNVHKGQSKPPPKRKGLIRRFLERMEKANKREFGDGGPCCH